MAILVMRPFPDNERTAVALRAAGYQVLLSPSLTFEAMPLYDDHGAVYNAMVVTSANALRSIEGHPILSRLQNIPLFTVGDMTAERASELGFRQVLNASGDSEALRELIKRTLPTGSTLCYLAGADLGRDLTGELGKCGYTVITHTTYRMIPVPQFTDQVKTAFAAGEIEAVLHYSRRSATTFVDAVHEARVENAAFSLPQCCISVSVAAVLQEAGASPVLVAQTPDENAILDVLARAIRQA